MLTDVDMLSSSWLLGMRSVILVKVLQTLRFTVDGGARDEVPWI